MKKKFTFLMAALMLLTMFAIPVRMIAETYEIVFKTENPDSNSDLGASPNVSNVVSSGNSYVASFSDCSKIYNGVNGIKLGSSKANGIVNFTLASTYQTNIKTIKVVSAQYGSDSGTLTLYSGSTSLHSGINPGTDYTYTFENPSTVTSIKLTTSSKRAYITKIVITTETGGGSTDSKPEWSLLPTPTIAINEEYELDLSPYVTGTPTPTITISTDVSNNLYGFEADFLIFQPTEAGTYEFTFTATNSEGSDEATLTVTAMPPTTYTLATSIVSGCHYIITNGTNKAMGAQGGNNRPAVGITISSTTATVETADVYEFVIESAGNGFYSIYDAINNGYLYAASSSGNHLKTESTLDENHNGEWEISINSETGVASVVASQSGNRNVMQYNSGSTLFSCYASASQSAVYLYAKADYTLTINGYGNDPDVETGWNLIASPLDGTTTVTNVTNMTSNNYDLFRFNLNEELEWENYKAHSSSDFTTLEVGRGYLYANSTNVTLGFNGALNTTSTVTLAYDGWNLIGNSSSATRYVSGDYYIMNSTNSGITASTRTGGAVNAMEGIFVNGDKGDEITFSSTPPSGLRNNNVLVINLNRNDKVIDCAIARLNSDRKLSKLTLFDDDTKIYIPQNGADYAIAVMDDNTQAFSLNFHAKTTGKYTLSLGETSNLSYVHIFDRMTGEDVDMLLEDSYSFIGSPADSEERFIVRLSYNASPTDSETFAYQSGNGIIVNGEGELQIFDVTGRKVMTTTINGVQTVNGLNNGLYIFKLNEKAQKIVVR